MPATTMQEKTLDRVRPPYGVAVTRWATVRIEAAAATYVGRVYVAENQQRLADVLADDRPFISLNGVTINGEPDMEPFVAVSKRCIRSIHVLAEGTLESGRRDLD
jgi:lipoate-protein ligase B